MTSRLTKTTGIYLITPETDDTDYLCGIIEQLLKQPVALLQYRHKGTDTVLKHRQAEALLAIAHAADVPLIINDDWSLALAIDADGVHLGQSDDDPAMVRRNLGENKLIGVSCYDDFNRAESMAAFDVDYLAFGAVFASPTKPLASKAALPLFQHAKRLGKPTVAIGGISPDNCSQLHVAGADFIAVISGVFDAPDPASALAAYIQSFT
jgi:thiamine-phosphate pyrophosphorylase